MWKWSALCVATFALSACVGEAEMDLAPEPPATRDVALESGSRGATGTGGAFVPGPLDGSFVFFGAGPSDARVTTAQVPALLDEMRGLGMSTVIVHSVRYKDLGCGGTIHWRHEMPEKMLALLDAAAARSMQVYVGLTFSMETCATFYESPNREQLIADSGMTVDALGAGVTSHPAFAGWYIPDEPGLGWSSMHAYYRGIVDAIRARSAAPILVAPYLARATQTPAEVADIAASFQSATGVTIQVWQDSVGADATPLKSGDRAPVEAYLSAISSRIGAASVWADTELFNYGPLDGYWDGAPYSPASATRINQQLWSERSGVATRRIAWLAQIHMGSIDPYRFPEAPRLRDSYRALVGLGGSYLTPEGHRGYAFRTAPGASYPDAGGELFDRQLGSPKSYLDPAWTGVLGNADIDVQLGGPAQVDWVAAHVMTDAAAGIQIPDSITIACDGVALGTWPRPFATRANDREYVIANRTALGARCSALTITLANAGWTFLDELEIVAASGSDVATTPSVPSPTEPAPTAPSPSEPTPSAPPPASPSEPPPVVPSDPTPPPPSEPPPPTPIADPAPTVVLVVHGVEYRGAPDVVTHPNRSIPASSGTYSIGFYADGAVTASHVCRLDMNGAIGVRTTNGSYTQLDGQGGPGAAAANSICAYCYVRPELAGSVVYSQTGSCVTITH